MNEEEEASGAPILKFLVGNKQDLVEDKEISTQQGFELSKRIGASFREVSAKENQGITELFAEISLKASKLEVSMDRKVSILDRPNKKKKKGCC